MVHLGQLVQEPVVKRSVAFELQGADGMGYSLYGVLKAVGPVVHWVYAPLVTLPGMLCTNYSIHYRVPQVKVS